MQFSLLLSVIIVSYNTQDLTVQTLKSVWASVAASPLLAHQTEVIIVDNQSIDHSVQLLTDWWKNLPESEQKIFVDFKVHLAESNLGFGRANNLAIDLAKGKYLLFLNSDTVVLNQALSKMVEAFESRAIDDQTSALVTAQGKIDRLGILAAQLLNPDQTVQPQGGDQPTLLSLASTFLFLDDLPIIGHLLPAVQHTGRRYQTKKVTWSATSLQTQDWVGGTAMMVRSALISEIGDFDPNIFMYGEDMELCLRAKNHHWDIAICPSAQIMHYGSASSSSKNALIGEFKGYLYIWAKHKPAWQQPILWYLLRFSALLKSLVFGTILGRPAEAVAYRSVLQEVLR